MLQMCTRRERGRTLANRTALGGERECRSVLGAGNAADRRDRVKPAGKVGRRSLTHTAASTPIPLTEIGSPAEGSVRARQEQ